MSAQKRLSSRTTVSSIADFQSWDNVNISGAEDETTSNDGSSTSGTAKKRKVSSGKTPAFLCPTHFGCLVWAKMKGFPPWPGVIVDPPAHVKQDKKADSHCIYFFGSKNYGWVERNNLQEYCERTLYLKNSVKSASFKKAVEGIEEYKEKNKDGVPANPAHEESAFDKLFTEASASPKEKVKVDENGSDPPPGKRVNRKDRPVKKKKSAASSAPSVVDSISGPSGTPSVLSSPSFSSGSRTPASRGILDRIDRPFNMSTPESHSIDLDQVSKSLLEKKIVPSTAHFGFLGLGIMGSGMVKNLIYSGHKVTVWNRSPDKKEEFAKLGALVAETPLDVASAADVIFCCVADNSAAREMVFGNCGVLSQLRNNKGLVQMTSIDIELSIDIHVSVESRGGRYLECLMQGSRKEAEEGLLTLLTSGDISLRQDCESCFQAIGIKEFFLGEVGNAMRFHLILQTFRATLLAGLSEVMALSDRTGFSSQNVMDVLASTSLSSPWLLEKGKLLVNKSFDRPDLPLKHLQKDLQLASSLADTVDQPLPIQAAVNQVFRQAKRLGYGQNDAAGVYYSARF